MTNFGKAEFIPYPLSSLVQRFTDTFTVEQVSVETIYELLCSCVVQGPMWR